MRNLKRALCLALACVMLVGMMVVGASAGYNDFTDKDKIVHDEAVKTLVNLNVIAGKEDGSFFDPTGIVTRAEMAKMICVVLNGGVEPVIGTQANATYSDIKGHWAEAYIEYCSNLGIVAGRGNGTFDPNGTVTGTEAAKMLLVAMGWDAHTFGLTGAGWDITTNVEANKAHLYEELNNLNPAAGLTRDNAAQMIYNAITEKSMERSWSKDRTTGEVTEMYDLIGDPLFEKSFEGIIYEGVLTASGKFAPYGGGGKEKASVYAPTNDRGEPNYNGEPAARVSVTRTHKEDATDLLGEYVKVLYDTRHNEVFGIHSVGKNNTTVLNVLEGNIKPDKKENATEYEISSEKYNVADNIQIVYVKEADANWATVGRDFFANEYQSGADVKLVDSNDDGKLDKGIVVDYTLATVNYVGSDSITINGMGVVKNDDIDFVGTKPVKNDKIIITPKAASYTGKYEIAVAESVEGKVTEIKTNNAGAVTQVKINGTWYPLYNKGGLIVDNEDNALRLNGTYKLFLKNGYAYGAKAISVTTDLAVVTGKTNATDFDGYLQTRMLLSDGTVVTGYMKNMAGDGIIEEGLLVAYEKSGERYKLYPVGARYDDPDDYDKSMAGYDEYDGDDTGLVKDGSSRTLAGRKIESGAVIFVQYDSNTGNNKFDSAWKVVSGADINKWNNSYGEECMILYKTSGMSYASAGIIWMETANVQVPGLKNQYGYVVSGITKGSDYVTYSMWDGSGEAAVTVTEKASSTNAKKGEVATFDWDDDGVVKNVKLETAPACILATDGTNVKLGLADETVKDYALADNVVILNVDTEKVEGVPGNAVDEAQQTEEKDVYYFNAMYKINSDDEITVLVIDVVNGAWNFGGDEPYMFFDNRAE